MSDNTRNLNTLSNIRKYYVPVQPTVGPSAGKVMYTEVFPNTTLRDYIYCYWQLNTRQVLSEPFTYRVVADGCIDIFFELSNPAENYVMGFCRKYTEFPLDTTFHYIGVRFLPTMFPQFFGVNASELSNRFEALHEVVPDTAQFIRDNIHRQQSIEDIATVFDNYFSALITQKTFNTDNRLYGALELILKNYGVIDIETSLDTGISPRQLRRLFEFYVGDTPKTFSKVVRFQNILRAKPSTQSLRQNKLFFDVGYYDQAHFIKDFKNFYGVTPSKAFGR